MTEEPEKRKRGRPRKERPPKRPVGRPRKERPPKRPVGRPPKPPAPRVMRRPFTGRVILVGEYSEGEPLCPVEVATLGWRIFRLLSIRVPEATHETFLKAFERHVLCPGMDKFHFPTAIANSQKVWSDITDPAKPEPDFVVLIGRNVVQAMGLSGNKLQDTRGRKRRKIRNYPYFIPFRYKGLRVRKVKDLSNHLISGADELRMVVTAILFEDLYSLGLHNK